MHRNEYELAFRWDGSFRSLYILDTTLEDWRAVLDLLHIESYPLTLISGDTVIQFPHDISSLFMNQVTHIVTIRIGQMQLNCLLSSATEIEASIDPREVVSLEQFNELLTFMRPVGQRLRKPVLITHELSPTEVFFRYVPTQDMIEGTSTETWW